MNQGKNSYNKSKLGEAEYDESQELDGDDSDKQLSLNPRQLQILFLSPIKKPSTKTANIPLDETARILVSQVTSKSQIPY